MWTAKIDKYEPFVGNLALLGPLSVTCEKVMHNLKCSTVVAGTARQSSQVGPDWNEEFFGAAEIGFPAAAHDNNFNSDFFKGSVTLTRTDPQAWWQMTLGSKKFIDNVTVYNRQDCCKDKLSNFYILLSKEIFSSARLQVPIALQHYCELHFLIDGHSLQVVLAEPRVLKYHFMYVVGISTAFVVKRNAVYVRVQLAGTNQLSLTEVVVRCPTHN